MSPHNSDQMSQWLQVSWITLCMAKVKVIVSEWVSQWVTRSPIELFWTAKNWYERMYEYMFVTNIFKYSNIFATLHRIFFWLYFSFSFWFSFGTTEAMIEYGRDLLSPNWTPLLSVAWMKVGHTSLTVNYNERARSFTNPNFAFCSLLPTEMTHCSMNKVNVETEVWRTKDKE